MRCIGLDLGKTSVKAISYENRNGQWKIEHTFYRVHHQNIPAVWENLKSRWQITPSDHIVSTGKLRWTLPFPRIVEKAAQEEAVRFLYPDQTPTLIRLGGSGFSVLNTANSGSSKYTTNHRCASGTGSFMDQILARIHLDIIKADELAGNADGAEITSRCGVTMKTDFTHLLNTGEQTANVVAGIIDASAKNAAALALKNGICSPVLVIGGLSVSKRLLRTIQSCMPPDITVKVPSHAMHFEALGAALIAGKMALDSSFRLPQSENRPAPLVFLPALNGSLKQVTKIGSHRPDTVTRGNSAVMGLDIGSTGSKLVIFDDSPVFEAYVETRGQPVAAAKELIQKVSPQMLSRVKAVGCTGSGREIVSSLLKASLKNSDSDRIFVLNEIAAHAAGAHYYDPEVDTIIDIGGQDAKFIRMEAGRVIDSCMNTVCSAGTGSFLAEQFSLLGIDDIKQLGKIAIESDRAVDLGQHCAVFISEQIDTAQQKGATLSDIAAGLYYSIVHNYNNRVKGFRDYGKKIFLQGKPAENSALSAALAQVTGKQIIVPPSPGCPGALGIALLTHKQLASALTPALPLDLSGFLDSDIVKKNQFRCHSKEGCITGNLCPIQTITVKTNSRTIHFSWGGACDKYEHKTDKNPALINAYFPFAEREKLIQKLFTKKTGVSDRTVSIPRGLEAEQILPLLTTFFQEVGFEVQQPVQHTVGLIEDGAKLCHSTFCAPIQILAGDAKQSEDADVVVLPKIIEISVPTERVETKRTYVCPLSQAMPDMLSPKLRNRVLQPVLNLKNGYESASGAFQKMGADLGLDRNTISDAFTKAVEAQHRFDRDCADIGVKALAFAEDNNLPLIAVLGHPYIVNSPLLLGSIHQAIHDNGAVALPACCYPLDKGSGIFSNIYWGYGQKLLQAAWQIRRRPGVYPLWLSVYSCGPDSFLLHFFQYLAKGKPYTILESDAYTGQAGFKTRIESFLYAIRNHQQTPDETVRDLQHFEKNEPLSDIKSSRRTVLIPWMGEHSKVMAGFLRSFGIKAFALPLGDTDVLEMGRKYTSGKECLPMIITLGSLLKHLENNPLEDFYYFMPQAGGPCRFGQYQRLFKIVIESIGLNKRVVVVSPTPESGNRYQMKLGTAATAKIWALFVFTDLLYEALHDIRPEEKHPGSAQNIFDIFLEKAEQIAETDNNGWGGIRQLWGLKPLAEEACNAFKKIEKDHNKLGKPRVLVTGEIYVRLDSFANNQLIDELEALGLKTTLSPIREWVNYVSWTRMKRETLVKANRIKTYLTTRMQQKIERDLYRIFSGTLGWGEDHCVDEILDKARPCLQELKPLGETALTIGSSLLMWDKREIQGSIITGPFECMPSRIAQTQLEISAQQNGLPLLTLSFNGEPLDRDILESFVLDLHRENSKKNPGLTSKGSVGKKP